MLGSISLGYALLHCRRAIEASVVALAAIATTIPAQAQGTDWNGFYAGAQAGGAWGDMDTDVVCLDTTPPASCPTVIAAGAFLTKLSSGLSGFIGGGQAGYNFQSGHFVYGFETDISWTAVEGSTSRPTAFAPLTFVTNAKQEPSWLGSVRGRLGFAAQSWLLYATGGFAFGGVEQSYSNVASNGNAAFASDSRVQTGWIVGGGGEYSFGHWSVKGEYLYYDLGSERLNAVGLTAGGLATGNVFQPDFETKGHIVRGGVNFPLD